MILCILVLSLFAPVALLPLMLSAFTPAALDEMGVCLEAPDSALEPTDAHSPCTAQRGFLNINAPILCVVGK